MKLETNPYRLITVKICSLAASGLLILFGFIGLFGWMFDVPQLRGGFPGFPVEVPNTLVGFVLAGLALWTLRQKQNHGAARLVGRVCSLMVAMIGALTVWEYLAGAAPGIDQLFFYNAVSSLPSPTPGRPAFLSAASFFLFGLALFLVDGKSRFGHRPVDVLNVTAITISLLAIIGHVFRFPTFYGWGSLFPGPGMALQIVLAFLVLGIGILCARPDRGLMEIIASSSPGGVLARRLLLAPAMIPLVTGWLQVAARKLGVYNAEFIGWLFAFLNILVLTIVIWWIARLLHKADQVRQQAEEDINRLNAELEQRVAERTSNLSQAMKELEQVNDALRESERMLRETGQLAKVGGWEFAPDTGVGRWTEEVARIHDLDPSIKPTRELGLQFYPGQNRVRIEAALREAVETGRSYDLELEFLSNKGVRKWIRTIGRPLMENGRVVMIRGALQDITERKHAELLLERQRTELQLILDAVPAIIFYKDAQHRLLRVNQELVRVIGLPKDAIEGKTDREMNSPHAERYCRDEDEIIASGNPKRGIVEPMESATGTRWLQTDKLPYRNETGQITGIIGFAVDITERRLAEQKLQEQLERLNLLNQITRAIGERQDLRSIFQVVVRTLEEQQPVDFCCLCLYDPANNVLTVTCVGVGSQELAMDLAMTEQARIDIDGNGLSRCVRGQLVYEPDISRAKFPFPQRLARGGLRALVAAPLIVESQVFGILVAARRKEESFSSGECEFLRQLSSHVALASHQAQLYGALQQAYDDLRQSQQAVMQQERLRSLGQMASGIAHDINNAISPVALYTESLLETEPNLSPRARDYLQTIRQAIRDVAETVARMREFYRQREPQLTLTPVHLNLLARQVLDLTHVRWNDMPQAQGVMIQLQTELAVGLPVIMGVESEIREALTNLIFNAVDAMTKGGTLTLRTRVSENSNGAPPPGHVLVEVSDTGIGMDEDTRRRCLEPFFTTKGERGTGLGLAMVYGMVQRHSADIEIISAPGEGTTVRLSFAVPASVAAGTAETTVTNVARARLRILIVDDDPMLLKSLRDILETDGHVVVTANGGQAGIDAFRAARSGGEPFAVVITDLGMPYVDGRKVASDVKTVSSSTPVILLTGWGQRIVAEGDVPPHVDHVLSKPPKLSELRDALARSCPF